MFNVFLVHDEPCVHATRDTTATATNRLLKWIRMLHFNVSIFAPSSLSNASVWCNRNYYWHLYDQFFLCGLFRSLSPWIAINDSVLHKFIVQRGLCKCAPFWRFGHSSSHKTIGIILLTLVRSHLFFLSRITK